MQTTRIDPTYEIFTCKINRQTKRDIRHKNKLGRTTVSTTDITAYATIKMNTNLLILTDERPRDNCEIVMTT
jgi:hypothetical protein